MITSKIFQRSQRHEWVEPNLTSLDYAVSLYRHAKRIDAIKPKQTVTKRYILEAYYEVVK